MVNDNFVVDNILKDELFRKLTILENKFNLTVKQTSLVWADVLESTFEKVKHSRPMISLDSTYNEDDLNDFNERVVKLSGLWWLINYTLEFKFDWLWVELIYKEGQLIQAITRWNGIEGEDVTVNVMQIENIPKTISYKKHLEVRWEVVMPISVFHELNEQAKKDWTKIFSNPRNAASWSLRMKDALVTKKRKLKFFAYDLANLKKRKLDLESVLDNVNTWSGLAVEMFKQEGRFEEENPEEIAVILKKFLYDQIAGIERNTPEHLKDLSYMMFLSLPITLGAKKERETVISQLWKLVWIKK